MLQKINNSVSPVLIDGHSDFFADVIHRYKLGEKDALQTRHLPNFRQAGLKFAFCAVAGDGSTQASDAASALRDLEIVHAVVSKASDEVLLIRSLADVTEALRTEKIGFFFGLEGASPLDGDPGRLETFYIQGIRWLTLTWNHRNPFADGLAVKNDRGLTPKGRQLIRRMEEMNLIIDLSHASKRTFDDVLDVATGTVIASHSNPWSVCPHERNITDERIIRLAEHGGTVGLCFFPAMVSLDHSPTVEDLVTHASYLRELIGSDHIAIGPDFIDYAEDLFSAGLASSGVAYGDNLKFPQGVASVVELPNLRDALLAADYPEVEVSQIVGGNLLRLIRRVSV